MITRIQIRDFALIDRLDLSLEPGFTVLTGETGAGKSILVDAIGLALGGRADGQWVRHGRDRAEIALSFDLDDQPLAMAWLRQHELDDDGEPLCILRRTLRAEGGSRAYINGRPATAAQLRQLAEHLVDIHGQHQHQSLLRPDYQQALLDAYGGHQALAETVAETARAWQGARRRLAELSGTDGDRERRADFLRYQLEELERLAPSAEEWAELEREHRRLANLEGLLNAARAGVDLLREADETVDDRLQGLLRELAPYVPLDEGIAAASALIEEAQVQLQEAAAELSRVLDGQELDPAAYQQLDRRLGEVHDLARKHRVAPERLQDVAAQLADELATLAQGEAEMERLRADLERLERAWRDHAQRLREARHEAAEALSRQVSESMQGLGMGGGRFQVDLLPRETEHPHPGGSERVLFQVVTNPGQPPAPLARIASGGELSRISLAIQVATAELGGTPTLIFDEVDVGIGGGVAELVGEKLRRLGRCRQILCVTHLPQVAAQGHHHLRIHKERRDDATLTRLTPLDEEARVEEIARMLGGRTLTDRTLAHAQEMLAGAKG